MKLVRCLILTMIGAMPFFTVEATEKISLPLGSELSRADIYIDRYQGDARGTLVLCPGQNGNGQELIENRSWVQFAAQEHLNLVGLSFASTDSALANNQGYVVASGGSGQELLDGLRQAFGSNQPPLLIYGFSRGAQFTYSFTRMKPDLVLSWCAYSATQWETPNDGPQDVKGIIACGDEDESNYSFSVLQFLKGRSMEKPWTWVSLSHTGHVRSTALDDFVRVYFSSILAHPEIKGLWLDVDTKTPVIAADLKEHPTLAVWLPNENVAQVWKNLHQP